MAKTTALASDAVVVGGGPAGCAVALGLAQAGARVVLCERTRALAQKPGEIVEPTIRMPLAELGLADAFEGLGSLMLAGSLSAWDDGPPVEFCGMLSAFGHGVLIDRCRFEAWLAAAAMDAGVHVMRVDRWLASTTRQGGWEVACESGGQSTIVTAPVVIEATGRGTGVLGHGRKDMQDRLVAFLTYGMMDCEWRDQRLLIEACEHGWWYAAPLPGRRGVLAFMTDVDLAPQSIAKRQEHADSQLATTTIIREFAAGMCSRSRLRGFPAGSGIRQVIHGTNWVSIGDAAASYDPLSGRGVAVALAKGAAVARVISRSSSLPKALRTYADAERGTFSDYLTEQRRTYRRPAPRFASTFWERRAA